MQPETTTKIKKMVENQYLSDVERELCGRTCCKITSDITETTGQLLIVASSMLSFAAGYWQYNYLSFIAGSLGVMSVSLLRFSVYSMKESKERTGNTNKLLTALKIDKIADDTPDDLAI